MRLLFFGTPAFAVPALEKLAGSRHSIAAVVTQPDRPKGRSTEPAPPPIKEATLRLKLPLLQPLSLKEPSFTQTIRDQRVESGVVVGYGKIFPPSFLELFPRGVYNLHASLLPRLRGAAPIQWALIRGERETGATVFLLDDQLDHGPILLQQKLRISEEDTAVTLGESLSQLGADLLLNAVDLIESGKGKLQPQDDSLATSAPILKKTDGVIRWEESCHAIHNRIRGVQPWPGAITWLQGRLLAIIAFTPELRQTGSPFAPGTVIESDPVRGLWIQAGKGQLRINQMQLEGKKLMSAQEFLRGHSIPVSARLTGGSS